MSFNHTLWGLDLGGTKIEICCFDATSTKPQVHLRERIETEQESGYDSIIRRIKELCEASATKLNSEITSIGIGHPGAHKGKDGKIKNSNTQCLNGQKLHNDLSQALTEIGIETVVCENDANCFALAEHVLGSAKLAKSSFGVILGTGVGGGLILEDSVIQGSNMIAGEWGHISVWDNGPNCYCGKKGCVESIISGPALEKLYLDLTNKKARVSEIISIRESSPSADLVFNRLRYWLGRGLANVINIFDPHCIVLGGGLSTISDLYEGNSDWISKWVFDQPFNTPVLQASLGDSAGVFGAGLLTLDKSD